MLSTITAIQQTVLKVSPVPSTELDPSQKIEIYKGQVLTILRKGPLDSGHMEVSLSENGGDWFIYAPHWNESSSTELNVRYFSQRDNFRDANRTCFSSTCAMLVEYLKPGTFPGEYGDDFYIKRVFSYGDTTEAHVQVRALQSYEVDSRFIQNGSISLLKNQIDSGKPIPVGILHHGPSSAPSGGGHWLLVSGYDNSGFICMDPWGEIDHSTGTYPSTDGEAVHYSYDLFKSRWTVSSDSDGWAIIV